jgi:hypothetical protein
MNQGIAFARTLRALEADDFRGSKLGFAIAAILLGAWAWWMLTARVPQYETAAGVRVESGRAIATFSSTAQIHPGQAASVTLDGGTLAARVESVTRDQAELVFTSQQPPAAPSTSATAEIEVSRLSPAAMVFHTLR